MGSSTSGPRGCWTGVAAPVTVSGRSRGQHYLLKKLLHDPDNSRAALPSSCVLKMPTLLAVLFFWYLLYLGIFSSVYIFYFV